jgi:glutamine synthetase
VEFRAADAAASPHLALAAVVAAGTLGMEAGLKAAPSTAEDLSLLSPAELQTRGLRRLPASLGAALDDLMADAAFLKTLPARMPAIYSAHKKAEIAHLDNLSETERFAAYAATY